MPGPPPPPNSSCKTSSPAKSSSNINSPNHVCVWILTYYIQPGFCESLFSLFLKPIFGVSLSSTHTSIAANTGKQVLLYWALYTRRQTRETLTSKVYQLKRTQRHTEKRTCCNKDSYEEKQGIQSVGSQRSVLGGDHSRAVI